MKRQFWLGVFGVAVICLAASHSSFAQRGADIPVDSNYRFAPGVRLLAGDKPIDVTTGLSPRKRSGPGRRHDLKGRRR